MNPKVKLRGKTLSPLPSPEFLDLSLERLRDKKALLVGVDEVGAGCLAGPLVAAAFAYPLSVEWAQPEGLVPVRVIDSKLLSEARRVEAAQWLEQAPDSKFELVEISPEVIDRLNIYHARMHALSLAVERVLKHFPAEVFSVVLVDGHVIPKGIEMMGSMSCCVRAITKGDQKVFPIAAASILAKQHRDTLMAKLGEEFPRYEWARNVGYPTLEHKIAIRDHGPTPWHRRSFNWSL